MQNRIEELDIMKFWGILLVVLGHITNMYTPMGIVHPLQGSSYLGYISCFIYSFHMPLFVFVSGSIYSYQSEILKRNSSILELIKKKSIRLLIPYVVFGILMIVLMVGCGFRNDAYDYAIYGILLSKDSRHLWFILMLFEVFFIFWLLYHVIGILRLPKWSLLIVSFLLYFIAGYLPYILQISSAFRYQFWFSLGYMFILYKQYIQKVFCIYILTGVILVVNLLYTQHKFVDIPFMSTIVAIAGILLVYQISFDFKKVASHQFFQIVNRNSFGIYLYHVFFVYLFFYFFGNYMISPFILVLVTFVVAVVSSVVMTELTRVIGLNWMIGERKTNGR